MNIITLKDIKPVPDIVHVYTPTLRESQTPLIIDNGSYQCRAGWACNDQPSLEFRNLIAKPRKDRNKKDGEVPVTPVVQIGNDIVNIEALRFQLRTQFDRNVVTHYHIQEQIFDYIFTHLGIDTDGQVPHPVVLTECFANPNSCRQLMSELLFECYDVPSVCYGLDSIFSVRQNQPNLDYALVISFGYHTTHIIPIVKGLPVPEKTRRINIGGFNILAFLHRILQLKYPVHVNSITLSRVEELLHDHCSIAYDYMDTLKNWASLEFYESNVRKIQLPFNQTGISAWLLTAEQRMEKKRELAKRLIELNAKRREEQQAEDQELLQRLLEIRELYREDKEEFDFALLEFQVKGIQELHKMIRKLTSKVERTKQRMTAQQEGTTSNTVEEKIPHPPVGLSVEDWVKQVKQQREALLDKRHTRRQRRQDLAKRHTAAAQERMRIISLLARKEKGTDDFGMRDEDWDIYKTISREGGDSDSEVENEKLVEFEEILRHHDPTFTIEEPQNSHSGTAEYHQLHLGVEIYRAPEILFQPSMIGSTEAGLAETIDFVLKLFPADEQLLLANNVFLTGSCAMYTGLKERLSRELLEMRPFQTPHKITLANNPTLDAWLGACGFTKDTEIFTKASVSKKEYDEFGGEYFKEHSAGNKYFPTPPAPIVELNDQ
ncbi:Actin-related protein 5 [Sergentomyia squamirostris]